MKTSNENSVITKKDLNKMFWRSLPMEFYGIMNVKCIWDFVQ